jgi:predicted RNase H-like HicB family nuclease
MSRQFTVVIERDDEGWLVGSVPALPGCHTQARSMDELLDRMREAIRLCLDEDQADELGQLELVGIHCIAV